MLTAVQGFGPLGFGSSSDFLAINNLKELPVPAPLWQFFTPCC
jgi:hypothetical protein